MGLFQPIKEKIKTGLLVFDFMIGVLVLCWYYQDRIQDKKQAVTYIEVSVTAYQPKPQYTDSTPYWTATGTPSVMGVCAVSQDLLKSGIVKYGDNLDIPGLGVFKVLDCMNKRHKNHIDILVYNVTLEKLVGWRKGVKVRILE